MTLSCLYLLGLERSRNFLAYMLILTNYEARYIPALSLHSDLVVLLNLPAWKHQDIDIFRRIFQADAVGKSKKLSCSFLICLIFLQRFLPSYLLHICCSPCLALNNLPSYTSRASCSPLKWEKLFTSQLIRRLGGFNVPEVQ